MAKKTAGKSLGALNLGEDEIIELVRRELGQATPPVLLGIGDDTAVMEASPRGMVNLLTTDMMVEGTHFRLDWASPYQAGWKAMAAAVSDIAAMGGRPTAALVSVGLTGSEKHNTIIELARGMKAISQKYAFDIAGGDTVRSKSGIVISVAVIGEMLSTSVVQRKGAKPGDALLVCGHTGASAAGLEVLRHKGKKSLTAAERRCVEKHLAPEPLIDAGRVAAATGEVTAMMDLSDGLSADLPRLCTRSGVGALVRSADLPICADTVKVCKALGLNPVEMALGGGEDYGLLLTASPDSARIVAGAIQNAAGVPVSFIGEIISREHGILLQSRQGPPTYWPNVGFRHF